MVVAAQTSNNREKMVESEDKSEEEEKAAISLAEDQLSAEVVEAFDGNPPIFEDEASKSDK